MKQLSEVLPVDKAIACPECGGFVFFDWGLKLLDTSYLSPSPRYAGSAVSNNVVICADCHHPVVNVANDYYDAVEFVSKELIAAVIKKGQARAHAVAPVTMDP